MFYACATLLLLERCQGCNRREVSSLENHPVTVTSDLEGIPHLGDTCYMNTVLQIITKLYPNIFEREHGRP